MILIYNNMIIMINNKICNNTSSTSIKINNKILKDKTKNFSHKIVKLINQ